MSDAGPPVPSIRRVAEAGRGGVGPGTLGFRLARPEDVPACARVWERSIADYERRLNQPVFPGDLGPIERLIGHIQATDPELSWVATRTPGRFWSATRTAPPARASEDHVEEVVAFGAAHVRGDVWFLSMLFVIPEEQGVGLGNALLERTFPGGSLPSDGVAWRGGEGLPSILGTSTDSAQPISNALYGRYGIVPRLPVYRFVGRPERPELLPALPDGVAAVRFDEVAAGPPDGPGHRELVDAIGAVDRALLGYERPDDHRFLRLDGRLGYLYRGPDGAPVGYGYTSGVGRLGPIATLQPALLAPVLAHLLATVEPRGASSVWITGAAGPTFRMLLEAGFELAGFPGLICWTAPFAPFDRYVPISLAIM